jgi:hypothetical protein
MTISKLVLSFLLFVGFAVAQDAGLNWAGWDTCKITSWKSDSFRVCKTMNLANAEDKLLVFVYSDTVRAARKIDTVVAEVGYQLGAPILNLVGKNDTVWTNCIVIDTVNSIAAGKRYDPKKYGGAAAWALDGTTDLSTRPHGQVDTTVGTESSAMMLPFIPYWAPYIRFYIKGLTGNTDDGFVRARFIFMQRKYVNVRNM